MGEAQTVLAREEHQRENARKLIPRTLRPKPADPDLGEIVFKARLGGIIIDPIGSATVKLWVTDLDEVVKLRRAGDELTIHVGEGQLPKTRRRRPKIRDEEDLRAFTVHKLAEMMDSNNPELMLKAAAVISKMKAEKQASDALEELRDRLEGLTTQVRGDAETGAVPAGTDDPTQEGVAGSVPS